jgi:hypothetical protein
MGERWPSEEQKCCRSTSRAERDADNVGSKTPLIDKHETVKPFQRSGNSAIFSWKAQYERLCL